MTHSLMCREWWCDSWPLSNHRFSKGVFTRWAMLSLILNAMEWCKGIDINFSWRSNITCWTDKSWIAMWLLPIRVTFKASIDVITKNGPNICFSSILNTYKKYPNFTHDSIRWFSSNRDRCNTLLRVFVSSWEAMTWSKPSMFILWWSRSHRNQLTT